MTVFFAHRYKNTKSKSRFKTKPKNVAQDYFTNHPNIEHHRSSPMSSSIISEKVVPTYHTVVTDGSWLLKGRCRRQDCQKGKDGGSWCLHFALILCSIDAGV